MKRKGMKVLSLAAIMTAAMTVTAFAGEWKQDGARWWWQQDDGNYPKNTWQWIDGNHDQVAECYYFDGEGYLLCDTVTPDQYTVNTDGAWVVNGVVQTQAVAAQAAAKKEISGINRNAGNGFIRQEYVDCLGRDESYVKQVFGEPMEIEVGEEDNTEYDILYRYEGGYDYHTAVHFRDGIVRSISADVRMMTRWESPDGYTLEELSQLMNTDLPDNILNFQYVWTLQNNPRVTFSYCLGMGTISASQVE